MGRGAGGQVGRCHRPRGAYAPEGESGKVSKKLQHHWDLDVYQMSVEAAMGIFEVSKRFPKEEIYSLTDQIRRSSRSVCANTAEACLRPRGAEQCSYMFFTAIALANVI